MTIESSLKKLWEESPDGSILNVDYSALEMRVIKSFYDKCPVCGEPIIDVTPFPDFSLKSHLAKQTDNVHAVLGVLSL